MPFYIVTSVLLFFIGSCGIFLSRKNLILVLMCLELMLLSVNMIIFFLSCYLDVVLGLLFIFYVLTIAASETAIGLSLIVCYYNVIK